MRVLASAGARVIMTSRDIGVGQQVARQMMQDNLKVSTGITSCSQYTSCQKAKYHIAYEVVTMHLMYAYVLHQICRNKPSS